MKQNVQRTISVGDPEGQPQPNAQSSVSTADLLGKQFDTSALDADRDGCANAEKQSAKTTLRPIASTKQTQPMKRNILMLTSILALPIWACAADDKKKDADNTGKNERDRDNKTLTPGDQSKKPEDMKLTQAIRQAVMKDKSLTMTAKNVKIITAAGKVTLRGPVNSVEEKTKINDLAKAAAGTVPVDNQLEVKAAK